MERKRQDEVRSILENRGKKEDYWKKESLFKKGWEKPGKNKIKQTENKAKESSEIEDNELGENRSRKKIN